LEKPEVAPKRGGDYLCGARLAVFRPIGDESHNVLYLEASLTTRRATVGGFEELSHIPATRDACVYGETAGQGKISIVVLYRPIDPRRNRKAWWRNRVSLAEESKKVTCGRPYRSHFTKNGTRADTVRQVFLNEPLDR